MSWRSAGLVGLSVYMIRFSPSVSRLILSLPLSAFRGGGGGRGGRLCCAPPAALRVTRAAAVLVRASTLLKLRALYLLYTAALRNLTGS